jgi:hypothetical protein
VRLGYEVNVIVDACRATGLPTGPGRTTVDDVLARFAGLGIGVVTSGEIG